MHNLLMPLACAAVLSGTAPASSRSQANPHSLRAADAPSKPAHLAWLFEPNAGRAPEEFARLLRLPTGWAGLSSARVALHPWRNPAGRPLEIELLGARPDVAPIEEGRRGHLSILRGGAARQWVRAAETSERLRFADVWPGIAVVYHAAEQGLRYDFELAPGADPASIHLILRGVSSAHVTAEGRLHLETDLGAIEQSAPVSFQPGAQGAQPVEGGFELRELEAGSVEVTFRIGSYDASLPLVIDPYFDWFALFGGSVFDSAQAVASDGAGHWFVAGNTRSADFPYYDFASQPVQSTDIVLLRFDDAGVVEGAAVLSGADIDEAQDVAFGAGGVFVTGRTDSVDFPIAGATYQTTRMGSNDAFVARLDADTLDLEWSTYLGGSDGEIGNGLAVDAIGEVVVAGLTSSADFPVWGTADNGLPGSDAFFTRLESDGSDLVWSGTFGGADSDVARAVALAVDGTAWFTGSTGSGTSSQAFVAPIAADGTALAVLQYGGSDEDAGEDIALDGSGGFWLLGQTSSNDFPLANPIQTTMAGASDVFLLHRPAAGGLDFATFFGGVLADEPVALALDPAANVAHVLLATASIELPVDNAMCPLSTGSGSTPRDAYVLGVRGAPDFDFSYGSYLPSRNREFPHDMVGDGQGSLLVAGAVLDPGEFPDMPAADPALPSTPTGTSAAFLVKIDPDDTGLAGTIRFGSLAGTAILDDVARFFIYRVGGNTGTVVVPWVLYDPVTSMLVNGYGGTITLGDGQQVGLGLVLLPKSKFKDGQQLWLVLQDPSGPADIDSEFSNRELNLIGDSGGDGGGGEGGGDDSGDDGNACILSTLSGSGGGRGLDRLRVVRDDVLSNFASGRRFTDLYYARGAALKAWFDGHSIQRVLARAAVRLSLFAVGWGEWLLLAALALRLRRAGPVRRWVRALRALPVSAGG